MDGASAICPQRHLLCGMQDLDQSARAPTTIPATDSAAPVHSATNVHQLHRRGRTSPQLVDAARWSRSLPFPPGPSANSVLGGPEFTKIEVAETWRDRFVFRRSLQARVREGANSTYNVLIGRQGLENNIAWGSTPGRRTTIESSCLSGKTPSRSLAPSGCLGGLPGWVAGIKETFTPEMGSPQVEHLPDHRAALEALSRARLSWETTFVGILHLEHPLASPAVSHRALTDQSHESGLALPGHRDAAMAEAPIDVPSLM